MSANWLGKFAFAVYWTRMAGKDLAGEAIPEWNALQPETRQLWDAAAETVYKTWFDEVEDKERERTS